MNEEIEWLQETTRQLMRFLANFLADVSWNYDCRESFLKKWELAISDVRVAIAPRVGFDEEIPNTPFQIALRLNQEFGTHRTAKSIKAKVDPAAKRLKIAALEKELVEIMLQLKAWEMTDEAKQ